jgi:diaminopimelate decarboxylase
MKSLLEKISQEVGTPYYLYHESVLLDRIQNMWNVFSDLDFHPTFAIKANANPYLLSLFHHFGIGADFISRGEYLAATLGNIPPSNMVWNGNAKSMEDIQFFANQNVQNVNVDSIGELKKWVQFKDSNAFTPHLFLRINPSIEASTHPYIKTGMNHHKFGLLSQDIPICFEIANQNNLELHGFHIHVGSQITDSETFQQAYSYIRDLATKYQVKKVNIGGGWGIPYYNTPSLDLNQMKQFVPGIFKELSVWCELGRFLIGEAGWYITRNCENRENGKDMICIADGGMNHLLRPSLYKAHHTFSCTDPSPEKKNIRIMGRLCETGDILVPETFHICPKEGSLIVVHQAGAYGFSMANHYNGFPLPAEVFLHRDGSWTVIRNAESEEYFLAQFPQSLHYDTSN